MDNDMKKGVRGKFSHGEIKGDWSKAINTESLEEGVWNTHDLFNEEAGKKTKMHEIKLQWVAFLNYLETLLSCTFYLPKSRL